MLYRCLKCEREVAAGCLPTVSCGLYLFGLMALAPAILIGLVMLARLLIPLPPQLPVEDTPWWVWVASAIGTPVLLVGGAWGLHLVFSTTEHFLMRWGKCPECGSRAWSKGFTRGFGL